MDVGTPACLPPSSTPSSTRSFLTARFTARRAVIVAMLGQLEKGLYLAANRKRWAATFYDGSFGVRRRTALRVRTSGFASRDPRRSRGARRTPRAAGSRIVGRGRCPVAPRPSKAQVALEGLEDRLRVLG